ncbi:MAG: CHAT domain-containing protein, partial [Acidobacteriota bacterium]
GFALDALESERTRGVELLSTSPQSVASYVATEGDPLLRAGLALAGANHVGEDDVPVIYNGIATAREASYLDLWGTDLVVLSACDTGVGSVRNGEGVYALSRSFREAGARRVLHTLWAVDDDATHAFMKAFYARFLAGTPARQALRETKLALARGGAWQHPKYWAPFVMSGER